MLRVGKTTLLNFVQNKKLYIHGIFIQNGEY
ncbi:hypothetical protein SCACP_40250 [Sporomusa carbonis]